MTLYNIDNDWGNINHWSATSGGSPIGLVPSNVDTVIFDNNSPSTVNIPSGAICSNISSSVVGGLTLEIDNDGLDISGIGTNGMLSNSTSLTCNGGEIRIYGRKGSGGQVFGTSKWKHIGTANNITGVYNGVLLEFDTTLSYTIQNPTLNSGSEIRVINGNVTHNIGGTITVDGGTNILDKSINYYEVSIRGGGNIDISTLTENLIYDTINFNPISNVSYTTNNKLNNNIILSSNSQQILNFDMEATNFMRSGIQTSPIILNYLNTFTVSGKLTLKHTGTTRSLISSSHNSNKAKFTLLPGATQEVINYSATRIDSADGQTINTTTRGILIDTINWYKKTSGGMLLMF